MPYAGWDPSYRTFQQGSYTAIGGETTLTNLAAPESVLFKNGKLLVPNIDYTLSISSGVVTLTTPAVANDFYQLLNFSTFHASDTYTKAIINSLVYVAHVTANSTTFPNLVAFNAVAIDCSLGLSYAVLPASPAIGCCIYFYDLNNSISQTNKFTVKRNSGSGTIMGISEDMDVTVAKSHFVMSWTGSDWRVIG